ncbi:unnamed protein product [Effrenium voratum]|nr:unnamed protein product [Effrenium voratum]
MGAGAADKHVEPSLMSVYLAVLLDKMGAMMVLPLLPFIARKMDSSPFAVGLLQSLYSLTQVFGTLLLGLMADVHGKRRILLLSLVSSSVALLAFGLSVSMWQLLLARAFHGFFSGTVSICQAIVSEVTAPEDRVGKMALIMAAYGVGVVLGPGLAGLIAPYGSLPVCAVAALCAFANFCLGLVQIPEIKPLKACAETKNAEAPPSSTLAGCSQLLRSLLADYVLAAVCFLTFCEELAVGIFMGVSALFFQDRYGITAGKLGLVFCAAGTVMVIFQGFVVSKLVAAIGRPTSILLGWVTRLAIFVALASLQFAAMPWLSAVCVVAGGALIDPSCASLTSDRASEGTSGIYLGVYQAAASVGAFVGPIIGGFLYCYEITAPYWMAAAVSLSCLPAVLALFRSPAPERHPAKEPFIISEEEAEQPMEKLLSEVSPPLARAINRAATGFRCLADTGASMFTLPLPELAARTILHKERISEECIPMRKSRSELHSVQPRAGRLFSRVLLRQYSMNACDRWSPAEPPQSH